MAEEVSIVEREAQIVAAVQISKLNCKQKQRLNKKEVISQLIKMLHAQDNQSVEAALFALLNLSFGSERVEAVEEGTGSCKEHAAGVLVLICKRSKERYKAMILSEGAMPGLLQLSVDGTRCALEEANALLLLLRDSSSAPSNHSRNVLMEEVMREIDGVGRVGTSIQLVEDAIAKLKP